MTKWQLSCNIELYLERSDLSKLVVEVGALLQPGEPRGRTLRGWVMVCPRQMLDPDTAARCLQLGAAA